MPRYNSYWRTVWVPQVTVRIPAQEFFGKCDVIAAAQRLGAGPFRTAPLDQPFNGAWGLTANSWAQFSAVVQGPDSAYAPYIFLEGLVHTDAPQSALPEGEQFRCEPSGLVRIETWCPYRLMVWIYKMSEALNLEIPAEYHQFARGVLPCGDLIAGTAVYEQRTAAEEAFSLEPSA